MASCCSHCGANIDVAAGQVVGRTEECPSCGRDLHACVQCQFYDPGAYNECREPQAERVVDKERSNFCDYFQLSEGPGSGSPSKKDDALKQLDDLFKK